MTPAREVCYLLRSMVPPSTQRHLPAWQRVAASALEATEEALAQRKAADAQKYAITSGIATEKCLLLEGHATQIVQVDHYRRDLPAMFQRLITNAAAVGVTIETAQLAPGTSLALPSERIREVSSSRSTSVVVSSSVVPVSKETLESSRIEEKIGGGAGEERGEERGAMHASITGTDANVSRQQVQNVVLPGRTADQDVNPSSRPIVGSKMNERSSALPLSSPSAVVAAHTPRMAGGEAASPRSGRITRRVTRPPVQPIDSFDALGDV